MTFSRFFKYLFKPSKAAVIPLLILIMLSKLFLNSRDRRSSIIHNWFKSKVAYILIIVYILHHQKMQLQLVCSLLFNTSWATQLCLGFLLSALSLCFSPLSLYLCISQIYLSVSPLYLSISPIYLYPLSQSLSHPPPPFSFQIRNSLLKIQVWRLHFYIVDFRH